MASTIEIARRTDFYKLFLVIERKLTEENIEVVVKMKFLEPMDILILTQFIIQQKGRECKIKITANQQVIEYLNAIKLISFCNQNIYKSTTLEAIPSYSAMPLRRVERDNMVQYIGATEKYFKTICNNKDLTMLNLCMSELINNVYDHSFSEIGAYVFCQFYPKKNEIKMGVSDLGVGIPKSVNTYLTEKGKDRLSSKDCVQWALKENKTTQSIPQNMGKGLDNVGSFVKANKGVWKLFSGDVLMHGYPSGNKYEKNPIFNFIGTIIEVTIKVNNLDQIEYVEDEDWNWN